MLSQNHYFSARCQVKRFPLLVYKCLLETMNISSIMFFSNANCFKLSARFSFQRTRKKIQIKSYPTTNDSGTLFACICFGCGPTDIEIRTAIPTHTFQQYSVQLNYENDWRKITANKWHQFGAVLSVCSNNDRWEWDKRDGEKNPALQQSLFTVYNSISCF